MPDIPQPDTVKTVERRLEGQPQGRSAPSREQPRKAIESYAETARATRDDDRITILGIPFEQITPATQAALAGLVAEINYLRGLVKRYERGGQRRGGEEGAAILEPAAFVRTLDAALAKEPAEGETWVAVMVHVSTYEDIRRSSGVLAANAALADVAARLRDVELPVGAGAGARLAVLGYAGGSNLAGVMGLPVQDLDTSAVAAWVREKLLTGAYNVAGIEMALAISVAAAAVGPGESGLLALARTDHLLLRTR